MVFKFSGVVFATVVTLAACAQPALAQVPVSSVSASASAFAQPQSSPAEAQMLGFAQAVQAAMLLAAPAILAQAYSTEWADRAKANRLKFFDAPELSVGHSSDALVGTGGKRVWELGVSAAWMPPALKSATAGLLGAEQAAWRVELGATQHRVQGELLEILSNFELAQLDAEAADAKAAQALALAQDVARRVKAGDAPQLDMLVMQAAVAQAGSAQRLAQSTLLSLLSHWRSKTGLSQWVALPTAPQATVPGETQHPLLRAASAAHAVALQRVALAQAERKEPMRYSAGFSRERGAFGESAASTWRVGISIPLQSDLRTQPKLSTAAREATAAELAHAAAQRDVRQHIEQAAMPLQAARVLAKALGEVASAQSQANEMVQRAYRLGERDLQARIKSDGERMDAVAAAQRQAALVGALQLKWLHAQGLAFIGEN